VKVGGLEADGEVLFAGLAGRPAEADGTGLTAGAVGAGATVIVE